MARRKKGGNDEDAKIKVNKEGIRQLRELYRFFKPYRTYFVLGLVALFFSSSVLLGFPFLTGKLVDASVAKAASSQDMLSEWMSLNSIGAISLALIGVLLIQSVFSFMRIWFFAQVSEKAMADMRGSLYQKLMSLPMSFFDSRRSGELMSRISSDVSLLQDTFSITLAELLRQIATLVFGLSILFFTTPKLTFFMLATVPVLVLAALVFGRFIQKVSKKTQDELAQTNVIVEETLTGIATVKAFGNELFETKRYKGAMSKTVKTALKSAVYRGAFVSFIIFALFGGIVGVLWYGSTLVNQGQISVGELTSFVIYTMFIGGSIGGLGDIYASLQKAIGASGRIREILNENSEVANAQAGTQLDKAEGKIEFQQVSFAYPSRKEAQVLNDVNLSIEPGQTVALVGSSGAGKSTLVQLLLRFYQLEGGSILFDGKSISDYSLESYRKQFALVPQEVILFGGSIKENIRYGKPEASDEEIVEAARKANALSFIQGFPEGFETLVGERGIKLSGGQRQRIAIARALLKDPKVLLLDEATSSLDAESENLVQEALDVLMKGRTTLVIAHRLSTVRNADKIYVLNKGKIEEAGSHQELLKNEEGLYAKLVRLQFEKQEI